MPRRIAKWLTPTRHENARDSRWLKIRREQTELAESKKDVYAEDQEES